MTLTPGVELESVAVMPVALSYPVLFSVMLIVPPSPGSINPLALQHVSVVTTPPTSRNALPVAPAEDKAV